MCGASPDYPPSKLPISTTLRPAPFVPPSVVDLTRTVKSHLHRTANAPFLKAGFATSSTFEFTDYCNYLFTALHSIGMIVSRLFATKQFAACTLVS